MAEKNKGFDGKIPADAHFGGFHFCGYCPWAMFYHWGCIASENAHLVDRKDIDRLREVYRIAGEVRPPQPLDNLLP